MSGVTHEQGLQFRFVSLGFASLTVSTVAIALPSMPDLSRLRRIVIRNLGQPINWRDDGTDPTAGTGMTSLSDELFIYDGQSPETLKLIRTSAATGDADVRIAYYGT